MTPCDSAKNIAPSATMAEMAEIAEDSGLPILAYRQNIVNTIKNHSVLILCGETGSGKSTQLPQFLLSAHTDIFGTIAQEATLIAHTQPRRVAAMSLAKRIHEEIALKQPDTQEKSLVGYKVRFEDRLGQHAQIALMTDGLLIAETAHDSSLRRYRAIIIDEAHERSLNIDFLMGYLKNLLPQRPDLKIIITSATLKSEKFSAFFGGAPVINVEGRSYPVSIRYQPLESSAEKKRDDEEDKTQGEQREAWREDKREEKLPLAIAEAIDGLWRDQLGDVLVFLPGEFEIRQSLEYLRGYFAPTRYAQVEVLPLMARLSSREQMAIFSPKNSLRIILSTNIAETSLTVPRIRYVVDSGLARVLRYSPRLKINRLDIEPIARDSALQRAGRCGRISAGVCVRLYEESEFNERLDESTPEILRSSLALVILRLLSLKWGDIRAFPWIDPPSPRMIHHGLSELTDLGAINREGELTALGAQMARLSIDHTMSRILIEAQHRRVLNDCLIIVSALSTREVRELPIGQEERARTAHRVFTDERSDFLTLINLWNKVEEARLSSESQKKFRGWCQQYFLSWVRLREWRELHLQLQTQIRRLFPHQDHVTNENNAVLKLSTSLQPATIKALHQSLLVGLPLNIGKKHDTEFFYLGPRGLKFFVDRAWANRKTRWIICAEIMASHRTVARRIAKIEPAWIIEALPHLVDIKNLEPFWDSAQQAVLRHRQVSLQGLMIEPRERIAFVPAGEDEAEQALECFIRGAFIDSGAKLPPPYHTLLEKNAHAVETLIEQENRLRRSGALVDDASLVAFYRTALSRINPPPTNTRDLIKALRADSPLIGALTIKPEEWLQQITSGKRDDYPGNWVAGPLKLPIRYTFAPGTADDGMSVTIDESLLALLPLHLGDWLVRGMLEEKVTGLIKTLPKRLRFALRGDSAEFVHSVTPDNTPLINALAQFCAKKLREPIAATLFREELLPAHLRMRYIVTNERGAPILDTRSISEIQAYLEAQRTRTHKSPVAASAPAGINGQSLATHQTTNTQPIASWTKDLGEFPRPQPMLVAGQSIKGHLVLAPERIDGQDCVVQKVFVDEATALVHFRSALILLAQTPLGAQHKSFRQNAPTMLRLKAPVSWFRDDTALHSALWQAALSHALFDVALPRQADDWEKTLKVAKSKVLLTAQSLASVLTELTALYHTAHAATEKCAIPHAKEDSRDWLSALLPPHFFSRTPAGALQHWPRYTNAIIRRLDGVHKNPARDKTHCAAVSALQQRIDIAQQNNRCSQQKADEWRLMLLELRVSLFAEKLGTAYPISIKRMEKILEGF